MDRVRHFLEDVRQRGLAQDNFLGLLNVVIGRRLAEKDGPTISAGVTWRELAALLKKVRWDREAVRALGIDPAALPPRDRQRYWYAAIVQAEVASAKATEAGDRLAADLRQAGYDVGEPPGLPRRG
jgi:hypothetical protein